MQVDKINIQVINFKSRFVPNKVLENAFKEACKTNDRNFALSVKTILNDGKDDVIELSQWNKYHMSLILNGEYIADEYNYLNYYVNVGSNLINKYVQQAYTKAPQIKGKYDNLSESEKKLIQENIDVLKSLVDNFENKINFIDNVQKEIGIITQKLNKNVHQELANLKKIIFNNK